MIDNHPRFENNINTVRVSSRHQLVYGIFIEEIHPNVPEKHFERIVFVIHEVMQ